MTSWTISSTEAGQRLDLFLVERLKDKSRSMLQKAIKSGQITVNGKVAMVHRFLKDGDVITYGDVATVAPKAPATVKPRRTWDVPAPTVIEETADWMVIDKPIGLLVHADSVHDEPTLVDWLLKRNPEIAKVGEDPVRPGIIHRLDREVSGLMIIAKTQAAYESFRAQFRDRVIKKRYLALVHGVIARDEGEIKFRIARSATSARMAARPNSEEAGRAAWTHYHVLERFIGATLVELDILSGRTHQIRAHMHALGRPVIGDELYELKQTDRNVAAPRVMLQSVQLTFQDPKTNEEKTFVLAPDPAFGKMIEEFRVS
jgi:23S rRNA pseudouridine1911/1915/1917 synthase